MLVNVCPFATLRETIGKQVVLEMKEGSKVKDVIAELKHRYPEFKQYTNSISEGVVAVLVLLNGRDIVHPYEFDIPLREGDEISLFPPIGGG